MKKVFFLLLLFIFNDSLTAQNIIKELPESAILFRLKTNNHLINYYLENGETEKAHLEKEKQKSYNNQIIRMFEKEWDFCPVYFFYSQHSKEITNKNFQHVFKGIDQQILNQEELNTLKNNFIVIYFGSTQGKLKFDALIISDQNLIQLKKPNPRFVRTYKNLGFLKRNLTKIIKILEKKIKWTYSNK